MSNSYSKSTRRQKDTLRTGVNDESYINQYFHYNPPTTVSTEKFAFLISDKGGMKDTRFINTNINLIKNEIKKHKTSNWDIINGKFTLI